MIFIVNMDTDESILHKINALSVMELGEFDDFIPKNLKHYNRLQVIWMDECKYLLGIKIGHDPSFEEFHQEYFHDGNHHLRFRAFYFMKYPEKVKCQLINTVNFG